MAKDMTTKEQKTPTPRIRDNQGLITLDFALSLVIGITFAMVFFAVSLTLSMAQVTQYLAYSTSRSHIGADESPQLQTDAAMRKYQQLIDTRVFRAMLITIGWFQIPRSPDDLEIGDFTEEFVSPGIPGYENNSFVGVRIPFQAKILNVRVPFLGRTANDTTTGRAKIASYLLREVSSLECREFNRARYDQLRALKPEYQSAPGSAKLITDNGC